MTAGLGFRCIVCSRRYGLADGTLVLLCGDESVTVLLCNGCASETVYERLRAGT